MSAVLLSLLACTPDGIDAPAGWSLQNDRGTLSLDPRGWFDLHDPSGAPIIERGHARLLLDANDQTGTALSTLDPRQLRVSQRSGVDALGEVQRLVVTRVGQDAEPDLVWTISAYPDAFTFRLDAVNTTPEALTLAKATPIRIDANQDGALYLGQHPSSHRILENGAYSALDMTAEVVPGDMERNEGFMLVIPGHYEGHSVSSWNHAVADLEGDAAWVAGALSFEASMPVMNLSYNPISAKVSDDGRTGFSYFAAEASWQPRGKPLAPGAAFGSELYYLRPGPDALQGLEDYADAVASHLQVVPWHRRAPGRRVPNGWNSWSASGSTGGYGTDINEAMILENLDIMATELRDWGMDWFQLDDGYELDYGDWTWREDRFPSGPAWLTEQIRDRGLRPGLWIAPFTAHDTSELYTAHPGWFTEETTLGQFVGNEYEVLDLTHPEVLAWIDALTDTFRNEWGFEWLKLDFGYYALLGDNFYDPTLTREEAWRGAMRRIREGLGEEAFFMLVGNLGINYDIVDSGRLTLDSMPLWEWEPDQSADFHLDQQGLKPIMRTAGRRWYLQDRVWVNHPDLIVFRSNTNDETWDRLTLDQSQSFCTYVGLSGGLVKLGDRLVDLDEASINTIRTLLPIYGSAARPLDVFTTEYPEIWHLPVDAPLDGYTEPYHLLGLHNWGYNVDQTTNPFTPLPDDGSDRVHTVSLSSLGLEGEQLAYEFWTGTFLGRVTDELQLAVPSETGRVVALREPTGEPQFLGWNRQITMGGTVLGAVDYDAGSRLLTLDSRIAAPTAKAPFVYAIAIYVPGGFAVGDVQLDGVPLDDLSWEVDGEVLRVRFVPTQTGDATLSVSF